MAMLQMESIYKIILLFIKIAKIASFIYKKYIKLLKDIFYLYYYECLQTQATC